MNHHSFRNAFEAALRGSGLAIFGVRGEDLLDLHNLDRIHRITVEPIGGQDAEPFLVTAVQFAILAWQEPEPRVHALCRPSGELMLEGLEIAAWQAIDVPRILEHPDHEPDLGPDEELAAMFGRTEAALSSWMQALDHLRA